jgi:3-dehydroquinate synthase
MSDASNLSIKTSLGHYKVTVGSGLVTKKSLSDHVVWVIDDKLLCLYNELIPTDGIPVEAIESKKSLETIGYLLERFQERNATRETRVYALGGGITQDLATFAASCYMRGLSWIYYPTTMLSMVDSCIGGKSSINVGRFKNLVGNFYPPDEVVVDINFCKTLTKTQMIEGLCEAAKICYVHSDEAFEQYVSLVGKSSCSLSDDQLKQIVALCLNKKRHFVEEDEFDKGIRQLLNLGHTFGHAIESATHYEISHGVAVGLGMLGAFWFSVRMGISTAELSNLNKLKKYIINILNEVPSLSQDLAALDPRYALNCFLADKKHSDNEYTVIAFNSIGRPQKMKFSRSQDLNSTVIDTFQFLIDGTYEIQ